MLTKKVYIPIGLCLLLILAIGFVSLRSNVPDEPVKIYKTATPVEAQVQSMPNGHVHADGTFHTEPHTETVETDRDNASTDDQHEEQLQVEKERLQAQVADLERVIAQNEVVIAEKRAIIKEVEEFDEWLSNVDILNRFSDLFDLLSFSDEEIREAFSAEEFKAFMTEKVSLFNTIREEFLNRIENCSPGAQDVIYERINATPELKRIYDAYIEKPFAPVGGLQ